MNLNKEYQNSLYVMKVTNTKPLNMLKKDRKNLGVRLYSFFNIENPTKNMDRLNFFFASVRCLRTPDEALFSSVPKLAPASSKPWLHPCFPWVFQIYIYI